MTVGVAITLAIGAVSAALVLAALADPGGGFGYRASHLAGFALLGAALTGLAFGIGGDAWGRLVLAAFAVTLVAGLAVPIDRGLEVAALVLVMDAVALRFWNYALYQGGHRRGRADPDRPSDRTTGLNASHAPPPRTTEPHRYRRWSPRAPTGARARQQAHAGRAAS